MTNPKDDLEKMRATEESATFKDWGELRVRIKGSERLASFAEITSIDYPKDKIPAPQKYPVGRMLGEYTSETNHGKEEERWLQSVKAAESKPELSEEDEATMRLAAKVAEEDRARFIAEWEPTINGRRITSIRDNPNGGVDIGVEGQAEYIACELRAVESAFDLPVQFHTLRVGKNGLERE